MSDSVFDYCGLGSIVKGVKKRKKNNRKGLSKNASAQPARPPTQPAQDNFIKSSDSVHTILSRIDILQRRCDGVLGSSCLGAFRMQSDGGCSCERAREREKREIAGTKCDHESTVVRCMKILVEAMAQLRCNHPSESLPGSLHLGPSVVQSIATTEKRFVDKSTGESSDDVIKCNTARRSRSNLNSSTSELAAVRSWVLLAPEVASQNVGRRSAMDEGFAALNHSLNSSKSLFLNSKVGRAPQRCGSAPPRVPSNAHKDLIHTTDAEMSSICPEAAEESGSMMSTPSSSDSSVCCVGKEKFKPIRKSLAECYSTTEYKEVVQSQGTHEPAQTGTLAGSQDDFSEFQNVTQGSMENILNDDESMSNRANNFIQYAAEFDDYLGDCQRNIICQPAKMEQSKDSPCSSRESNEKNLLKEYREIMNDYAQVSSENKKMSRQYQKLLNEFMGKREQIDARWMNNPGPNISGRERNNSPRARSLSSTSCQTSPMRPKKQLEQPERAHSRSCKHNKDRTPVIEETPKSEKAKRNHLHKGKTKNSSKCHQRITSPTVTTLVEAPLGCCSSDERGPPCTSVASSVHGSESSQRQTRNLQKLTESVSNYLTTKYAFIERQPPSKPVPRRPPGPEQNKLDQQSEKKKQGLNEGNKGELEIEVSYPAPHCALKTQPASQRPTPVSPSPYPYQQPYPYSQNVYWPPYPPLAFPQHFPATSPTYEQVHPVQPEAPVRGKPTCQSVDRPTTVKPNAINIQVERPRQQKNQQQQLHHSQQSQVERPQQQQSNFTQQPSYPGGLTPYTPVPFSPYNPYVTTGFYSGQLPSTPTCYPPPGYLPAYQYPLGQPLPESQIYNNFPGTSTHNPEEAPELEDSSQSQDIVSQQQSSNNKSKNKTDIEHIVIEIQTPKKNVQKVYGKPREKSPEKTEDSVIESPEASSWMLPPPYATPQSHVMPPSYQMPPDFAIPSPYGLPPLPYYHHNPCGNAQCQFASPLHHHHHDEQKTQDVCDQRRGHENLTQSTKKKNAIDCQTRQHVVDSARQFGSEECDIQNNCHYKTKHRKNPKLNHNHEEKGRHYKHGIKGKPGHTLRKPQQAPTHNLQNDTPRDNTSKYCKHTRHNGRINDQEYYQDNDNSQGLEEDDEYEDNGYHYNVTTYPHVEVLEQIIHKKNSSTHFGHLPGSDDRQTKLCQADSKVLLNEVTKQLRDGELWKMLGTTRVCPASSIKQQEKTESSKNVPIKNICEPFSLNEQLENKISKRAGNINQNDLPISSKKMPKMSSKERLRIHQRARRSLLKKQKHANEQEKEASTKIIPERQENVENVPSRRIVLTDSIVLDRSQNYINPKDQIDANLTGLKQPFTKQVFENQESNSTENPSYTMVEKPSESLSIRKYVVKRIVKINNSQRRSMTQALLQTTSKNLAGRTSYFTEFHREMLSESEPTADVSSYNEGQNTLALPILGCVPMTSASSSPSFSKPVPRPSRGGLPQMTNLNSSPQDRDIQNAPVEALIQYLINKELQPETDSGRKQHSDEAKCVDIEQEMKVSAASLWSISSGNSHNCQSYTTGVVPKMIWDLNLKTSTYTRPCFQTSQCVMALRIDHNSGRPYADQYDARRSIFSQENNESPVVRRRYGRQCAEFPLFTPARRSRLSVEKFRRDNMHRQRGQRMQVYPRSSSKRRQPESHKKRMRSQNPFKYVAYNVGNGNSDNRRHQRTYVHGNLWERLSDRSFLTPSGSQTDQRERRRCRHHCHHRNQENSDESDESSESQDVRVLRRYQKERKNLDDEHYRFHHDVHNRAKHQSVKEGKRVVDFFQRRLRSDADSRFGGGSHQTHHNTQRRKRSSSETSGSASTGSSSSAGSLVISKADYRQRVSPGKRVSFAGLEESNDGGNVQKMGKTHHDESRDAYPEDRNMAQNVNEIRHSYGDRRANKDNQNEERLRYTENMTQDTDDGPHHDYKSRLIDDRDRHIDMDARLGNNRTHHIDGGDRHERRGMTSSPNKGDEAAPITREQIAESFPIPPPYSEPIDRKRGLSPLKIDDSPETTLPNKSRGLRHSKQFGNGRDKRGLKVSHTSGVKLKRKLSKPRVLYRQKFIGPADSKSTESYGKVNVKDLIDFLATLSRNTVGTLSNKRKALRLYRNFLTHRHPI